MPTHSWAQPRLKPLLHLNDPGHPQTAPSSHEGNGHTLPDWRTSVATVALLATLLAPQPPWDEAPLQGTPSKEDLLVLQGACELALQAMDGFAAAAAAGDGVNHYYF